jgi:hypothetical protein
VHANVSLSAFCSTDSIEVGECCHSDSQSERHNAGRVGGFCQAVIPIFPLRHYI